MRQQSALTHCRRIVGADFIAIGVISTADARRLALANQFFPPIESGERHVIRCKVYTQNGTVHLVNAVW
jgi:hypothetical protein